MGDPAQITRLADEMVAGLIEQVKPEILFRVWEKLAPKLSGLTYPTAELITHDENEEELPRPLFECPHCFKEVDYTGIRLMDADLRRIRPHDFEDLGDGDWGIHYDSDEAYEEGYEDVVLFCGQCLNALDLPSEVSYDWD